MSGSEPAVVGDRVTPTWANRLHPRVAEALRWAGLLLVSWVILRPALIVTISLDDFINPFSLLERYGPSPFEMVPEISRDLTRNGHFNYIGQNVGSAIYVMWAYMISWGVRYSLIYATTKFVVFMVTALVVARLLRTLAALVGRSIPVWNSRALVCVVLFSTLQLHVAWGLDPVGSFPLFGYLPAAVGLLALDYAIRAAQADDRRSLVIAAVWMCLAVQHYELNIVVVAALLPIAIVVWRSRAGSQPSIGRRAYIIRLATIVGPCLLMVAVLSRIAAAANRGYTGTDVTLGDDTAPVFLRALAGSLPASAWLVARDWLAQPVALFSTTVVAFVIVAAVVLAWRHLVEVDAVGKRQRRSRPVQPPAPTWFNLVAIIACPATVWFGATAVQAVTSKVRAETPRVGYVYTYYAYGSIGVVLIGLLVVLVGFGRATPRSLRLLAGARPLLVALALGFVLVQSAINDNVQRTFDQRLAVNNAVLVAFSDEAPEAVRCAALQAWSDLPFWQAYYRSDFIEGLNVSYQHLNGEPFCSTITTG
jgi:hypothetical protein